MVAALCCHFAYIMCNYSCFTCRIEASIYVGSGMVEGEPENLKRVLEIKIPLKITLPAHLPPYAIIMLPVLKL